MKKVLSIIVVLVCVLSFVLPTQSTFAATKSHNEEQMEKEYKTLMGIIKEKVMDDWTEEEIQQLPEVIKFKEKYSEEEIYSYLNNKVKVYDQKLITKKLENTELGPNEKQVIDFEDGSFVVVETNTMNTDNTTGISPMANHSGKPGSSWKTKYEVEFWGIYLAARAVLNTHYTVNKSSIKINDVTAAGSKANPPTTLQINETKPIINNAKRVQSRGSYTKVNGVVIGGQPIGFTHHFSLRTTIEITSSSSSTVKWKTSSSSEG